MTSTAASFRGWLFKATPGETFEYHRGVLARDRSPDAGGDPERRRTLCALADAAFDAAERGHVFLIQRRNGPFDFSYVAVKAGISVRRMAARVAAPLARAAA